MEVYRGHLTDSYAQHRSDALFVKFEMEQNETKWHRIHCWRDSHSHFSVQREPQQKWPRIPSCLKIFVERWWKFHFIYIYLRRAYNHNAV